MAKRTFGVAVIGAGWVSGEHVKAYMANPHTKLIGMYSRDPAKVRAKLEECGTSGKVYATLTEVLDDPNVHIVSICTPPDYHAEQVVEAAQAGKHMVIEKPLAMTPEDVWRMQDAVRKAGVATVVSFVLRWNPMFETTKQLLEDDAIGRITFAQCDYWHWIGPHYKQYEWARTKRAGGSSLLSAGCHAVDALRWFVGEVEEVFAYSARGLTGSDYEFEPNIVAVLKFGGGAIGKVSSVLECRSPYVFNAELMGEKGTIRNNRVYSHKFPGQSDYLEYPTILPDSGDVTHHPFQGEIDHFIQCLVKGAPSHTDIHDAVKTMEVCFAIDKSAATGQPVQLPLART